MEEVSVIAFKLSQFFGLYMVILAFVMFNRVHMYRRLIEKMDPESGTILLGALVGLVFGLFFVGINNDWRLTPGITVTLIEWTVLIVSLLWLAMPEQMIVVYKKLFLGKGYYIFTISMGLSGLIMLARGVYIFATHHREFPVLELLLK